MRVDPGALYWIRRGRHRLLAAAIEYAGGGYFRARVFARKRGLWGPESLHPVAQIAKPAGAADARVRRAVARADSALTDLLLTAPPPRKGKRKARRAAA